MGQQKAKLNGAEASVNWESVRLTVAQAAAVSNKTPKAFRMDIARHRVPFHRWGRTIVILKHELLEFLSDLPGVSVAEARANAGNNE